MRESNTPLDGVKEKREAFAARVAKRQEQKRRAQQEKLRTVWFGLGTFGLVGWSVTIPTLLGIAIGVWVDTTWPSQYSWTLMLLVAGAFLGAWNAWLWIDKESRHGR